MQFFFIRHGQSVNNLLYATTGSDIGRDCDPELSAIGRQQVEFLADYLQREHFVFTHLYTSLMVRAVSTGAVVAGRLRLPLVAWMELHEEGGIYLSNEQGKPIGQPGKDRAYFEEYFPGLILPETLDILGWWNRPYEAQETRAARAQRFLMELLSRHGGTDHRVAVISHGGFYNLFLASLLNLPRNRSVWFEINNAAISQIDFNDDSIKLIYHNRVDFLPRELIT